MVFVVCARLFAGSQINLTENESNQLLYIDNNNNQLIAQFFESFPQSNCEINN